MGSDADVTDAHGSEVCIFPPSPTEDFNLAAGDGIIAEDFWSGASKLCATFSALYRRHQ